LLLFHEYTLAYVFLSRDSRDLHATRIGDHHRVLDELWAGIHVLYVRWQRTLDEIKKKQKKTKTKFASRVIRSRVPNTHTVHKCYSTPPPKKILFSIFLFLLHIAPSSIGLGLDRYRVIVLSCCTRSRDNLPAIEKGGHEYGVRHLGTTDFTTPCVYYVHGEKATRTNDGAIGHEWRCYARVRAEYAMANITHARRSRLYYDLMCAIVAPHKSACIRCNGLIACVRDEIHSVRDGTSASNFRGWTSGRTRSGRKNIGKLFAGRKRLCAFHWLSPAVTKMPSYRQSYHVSFHFIVTYYTPCSYCVTR